MARCQTQEASFFQAAGCRAEDLGPILPTSPFNIQDSTFIIRCPSFGAPLRDDNLAALLRTGFTGYRLQVANFKHQIPSSRQFEQRREHGFKPQVVNFKHSASTLPGESAQSLCSAEDKWDSMHPRFHLGLFIFNPVGVRNAFQLDSRLPNPRVLLLRFVWRVVFLARCKVQVNQVTGSRYAI